MDIFNIESLIAQHKILTSNDIDPNNDYVQVGKWVRNNRRDGGNGTSYESFAVAIKELLSAPAATAINYAKTVFVDTVFGNDTTGTGERLDLPFKTIDAAILYARANQNQIDLIYIREGSDTVNVTSGLNFKTPLLGGTTSYFFFEGGNFTISNITRALGLGSSTVNISGNVELTFTSVVSTVNLVINVRSIIATTVFKHSGGGYYLHCTADTVSCSSIFHYSFNSAQPVESDIYNIRLMTSTSPLPVFKYGLGPSRTPFYLSNIYFNIQTLNSNTTGGWGVVYFENIYNGGTAGRIEWNGDINNTNPAALFLVNGIWTASLPFQCIVKGNFVLGTDTVVHNSFNNPGGGSFVILFSSCNIIQKGTNSVYYSMFGVDQISKILLKDCIIRVNDNYSELFSCGLNYGSGADGTAMIQISNCVVLNSTLGPSGAGAMAVSYNNSLLKVTHSEFVTHDPAQLSLDANAPSTAVQVYASIFNNPVGLNVTNGLTGIPIDVNSNLII